MRVAFRSEPKPLAIFSNLHARYFLVEIRGACRSKPKFLDVCTISIARCVPVRTKIPGDFYQFGSEAFFGQNRNSWRYFPARRRGVILSEPKLLATVTSLYARRFSVRTEIPSIIPQFTYEAFCEQDRNSWRFFPV